MSSVVISGNTSGTVTIAAPAVAGSGTQTLQAGSGTVALDNTFGFKNRLINGCFRVDQRNNGASQTITAAAALAYTVDRWYAYCTGANVTGQRVAGTGSNQYNYQFTGAASVTGINFAQRIETLNSYDLNGQNVTLSVYMSNSLLTSVTWTAYYANTSDTFGSVASPTVTQIATGTFTVSSTYSQYTANIAIPAAATTGIQIVFSVGAQTSGTWVIGYPQLELGTTATSFDIRDHTRELSMCQRYYSKLGGTGASGYMAIGSGIGRSGTSFAGYVKFPITMRVAPTISYSGLMAAEYSGDNWVNFSSIGSTYGGLDSTMIQVNVVSSVLSAGMAILITQNADGTAFIAMTSEL